MTRWFTSDLHLWHANIITFCNRPFADAKEMNEKLLENWNTYVKPEDHVYNLGDVTLHRGGKQQQEEFIKFHKQFNGHKRLFLGNHDHWPAQVYLDAGFEKLYGTWRDEQSLIYSHFPLHPSSLSTVRANVHGHIHDQDSPPPARFQLRDHAWVKDIQAGGDGFRYVPYINISVERTNYHPINFEELEKRIKDAVADARQAEGKAVETTS